MARTSRITELAALIAKHTARVDKYLQAKDLPSPSFNVDGPTILVMKSTKIEELRLIKIGASMELQDLLQGPIA